MGIEVNNLHPNWRYLHLSHIRQLRMMARTGHPMYRSEARSMIKKAQREMADIRAAVASTPLQS
jgi:hypothetical protein